MPRKPSAQLDTLLRVRRRQEDAHARDFALARNDVLRAERELANIETRQQETMQEAGRRARKEFDAAEVRLYYQYERHLAWLADAKSAELVKLRGVVELRRAELEQAMKRRRIMEKLIERKQRTYLAEVRKDEQHFADETAVNRAAIARARTAKPRPIGLAFAPESLETETEQIQ